MEEARSRSLRPGFSPSPFALQYTLLLLSKVPPPLHPTARRRRRPAGARETTETKTDVERECDGEGGKT